MKFHQLSLGQPFEYLGQHFIKTSPIMAWCDESDSQQIVPRSAMVRVTEQVDNPSRGQPSDIPLRHARQVLLKSHAYCSDCLQSMIDEPTPELLKKVMLQLEQAQKRFLQELENK